jgi:DNA invertase Pin-like site-specific DNA recombinase
MLAATEKITSRHLNGRAYVYIRQSSAKQVLRNQESQFNQRALVDRAVALGWRPERIEVIDADQGQSGQDGERVGFQGLVAAVSLGQVGCIFAYEASRLARNNRDWYTLLDLATVVGTLIADADGVYDPRSYNDRLLLGLRGMLSEAELHLLRLRLDAGRMRQVERGTYRQHLPTGLVRLPDGRVVKDPDEQIQRTITLVFSRFATLGSAQKVLRSLHRDDILLPRHQTSGLHAGQLVWKKPTSSMIQEILHNPAYAGAFVYGRHGPHPDRRPGQTRQIKRAPEEWTALQHDVYPAYIRWEEFVANQDRLTDNAHRFDERTRGAPREGAALLVGLVVCGRCGRQMRVTYKPQIRYFCNALSGTFAEPMCLHLDGASIDATVVDAFFMAMQPAELDLLDEVLAAAHADHARLAQHYADQGKRAEYEARLAQRQYDAIDPDNRLVAAELERRWELALRALEEAREAAERFKVQPGPTALDPTLRAQLQDVSTHLPTLWDSERLNSAHKKELLRSLIRRVILSRPVRDTVEVKIVWVSGATSVLEVHPPIYRDVDLGDYQRLVERTLALRREGHSEGEIARRLTDEGFRSARLPRVPKTEVGRICRGHDVSSVTEQFRGQVMIDGQWTVWGLSRHLGVQRNWLYKRIQDQRVPTTRHPVTGHYLIPNDPKVVAALAAEVPSKRHR